MIYAKKKRTKTIQDVFFHAGFFFFFETCLKIDLANANRKILNYVKFDEWRAHCTVLTLVRCLLHSHKITKHGRVCAQQRSWNRCLKIMWYNDICQLSIKMRLFARSRALCVPVHWAYATIFTFFSTHLIISLIWIKRIQILNEHLHALDSVLFRIKIYYWKIQRKKRPLFWN